MEKLISDALQRAGVAFSADPRETSGLDFRVDSPAIHIEVKQFHSPRIAEQMSRADDVVAVQGQGAVEWLAGLIASRRIDELLAANNAYLQRARDAEAHRDELKAALAAHEEITESCGICRHPFVEGVLTLHDISMGEVHAACCGPERDSYVNLETGEPIGPDEPIPMGTQWVRAPAQQPAPTWPRHRLRIDLSGVCATTIDYLRGVEHPLRGRPTDDDRDGQAAILEQVAEHLGQVREGKASLADFADFYCLTPARGAEQ